MESDNVMSGKWKVQILWHLSFGPHRFAELRKKLPTISENVPADQLRQLEGDKVLTRKVTTTNPPQVTYSLNAEGKKLGPLMETLCDWGQRSFWDQAPSSPPRNASSIHFSKRPLFRFSRSKIIRSNAIGNPSRGE
jgi:DNA-binding HxlR family transcriptional regulator